MFVLWDADSQSLFALIVRLFDEPSIAVLSPELIEAVRAAVDDARDGLSLVSDGDGEDRDVWDFFQLCVVHGPVEVLIQVAADDFLRGNTGDKGVTGAHADFEEVVECFLGWKILVKYEMRGCWRLTVVLGCFDCVDVRLAAIAGKQITWEHAKVHGPVDVKDRLIATSVELVEEEIFFVCEIAEICFIVVLDTTVVILNFEIAIFVLGKQCLSLEIAWTIKV